MNSTRAHRPTLVLIALTLVLAGLSAITGVLTAGVLPRQESEFDLIIAGGRVIDGTGNPWFKADVGIRDGRIVAVGNLEGLIAARTVDARGKVVVPGFIDLHSHADGSESNGLRSGSQARRAAPNLVAQGITTVVVNQDGGSPESIAGQRKELEAIRFGPNAVLLVGHNTVRARALADNKNIPFAPSEMAHMNRHATREEVAAMRVLVREGMEAGAYGLSAGLEYVPGRWSATDELVALVEEIVPYGGVYIQHERSSGADPMWYLPSHDPPGQPTYLDSVLETIEIAERTGATAVITHAKAKGATYWGSSHAAIQLIERARQRGVSVWADHYPYTTTGTDGSTRLIPGWVTGQPVGSEFASRPGYDYAAALREVMRDKESSAKLRRDIRHELDRRGGPEHVIVVEYPNESWIGRTLAEIARQEGIDVVDLAIQMQLQGYPGQRGGARLRGFSLSEIDVEAYASQGWMATATDAGISLPEEGLVHPRYYGTYPRKIRRYAIERGVVSVEGAIRSATSLPAQILGFRSRGLVREGFHADLVVLDLETIQDTATFFEPHQYPQGIDQVLVNGVAVVEDGKLTGALPGVVITPAEGRLAPMRP